MDDLNENISNDNTDKVVEEQINKVVEEQTDVTDREEFDKNISTNSENINTSKDTVDNSAAYEEQIKELRRELEEIKKAVPPEAQTAQKQQIHKLDLRSINIPDNPYSMSKDDFSNILKDHQFNIIATVYNAISPVIDNFETKIKSLTEALGYVSNRVGNNKELDILEDIIKKENLQNTKNPLEIARAINSSRKNKQNPQKRVTEYGKVSSSGREVLKTKKELTETKDISDDIISKIINSRR